MRLNTFHQRKVIVSISVICLLMMCAFISVSYSHPVGEEIKEYRNQFKKAQADIFNEQSKLATKHRILDKLHTKWTNANASDKYNSLDIIFSVSDLNSFLKKLAEAGMSIGRKSPLEPSLETAYTETKASIDDLQSYVNSYNAALCMLQYLLERHNNEHVSPTADEDLPTGPSKPWNIDRNMPEIPCRGQCGDSFPTTQSPHYVQCGDGASESVDEEVINDNQGITLPSDIHASLVTGKLRARDAVDGCGRFYYNCVNEETHKLRTCQKWIIVNGVRTER